MANFTYSSAFTLAENPINSAGSSSAAVDDDLDDACSVCLEPFTTQDPPTVTSCKHEYHLRCILEWSQRSKECPICWQLLVLKDPASQELLAAVENERRSRSRNISPALPRTVLHFHDDFDVEEDAYPLDDSDFNERVMQHLATAASRAHFVHRRERQRSSGLGPSQVLEFASPADMPSMQQTYAISPGHQNTDYGLPEGDSPTSGIPSSVDVRPPSVVSSDDVFSSTAPNRDGHTKPRVFYRQSPPDSPRRPNPSEMFSFPESIKSKWSAASARYKESLSKRTRGLKEKLLVRNNSVKELSKGVQREMSAGIAGVARMIERLDLASRRPGAGVPETGCTGGMSDFTFKGKSVEENVTSQTPLKISVEVGPDINSEASSFSRTIPGGVGVSQAESH